MAPSGKIPAIDIDGFKLFESNAINKYLATTNNSSLYPKDAKKQAVIDAWLDYASIHVGSAVGRIFFNRFFAPIVGQTPDQESIKVGLGFLDKYFPYPWETIDSKSLFSGQRIELGGYQSVSDTRPVWDCSNWSEQICALGAMEKRSAIPAVLSGLL